MILTAIRVHDDTDDLLTDVYLVCQRDHYLHRWPDPRSLPFAYALAVNGQVYAADGRLNGIVVFKKPQHHQQRGLFGYKGLPTSWQVLDLARVWVHPDLQHKQPNGHAGNVFSQMVGLLLRPRGHDRLSIVQRDWIRHHPPRFPNEPYHIEVVISYCDLEHHDGAAYRASGFTWNGYTADRTKEVYYRLLTPPRADWRDITHQPAQLPLFSDMPLVYAS